MESDELKNAVKERYGAIARQSKKENETSCCGSTCCSGDIEYTFSSESYEKLEGYDPEADLGLGCGIPTEFALIKEGDTVIDLGSGAGNDCFVARALVGEKGKVIGVDFTGAMIEKARGNAEKLGYNNVEFRYGDIEKLPVTANSADVIISNCVLNLVPDKVKAFGEIFRVLKPGGHLSVSDVVLQGELPAKIKDAAAMYAGCVSGALQKDDYLKIIENQCFVNVKVQKMKSVTIADDILLSYLDQSELEAYKASGAGIYSITVYAEKTDKPCSCC